MAAVSAAQCASLPLPPRARASRSSSSPPSLARRLCLAQPLTALLRVERHAGARVIYISGGGVNRLNVVTVRALYHLLSQLESNNAVTTVVLRGATDDVFCTGVDGAELQRRLASPDTRRIALEYTRHLYKLQQLVAQYTKPLVVGMHGATTGSAAYALAANAPFSYVADNALISISDITSGMLPHGGATYHLARVPAGVGMYAALTGAVFRGIDAFWAGLAPLYGLTHSGGNVGGAGADEVAWSTAVARAAGDINGSATRLWRMEDDPVYAKALATLREHRAANRLQLVSDNLGDDISRATFDHYTRLKRWYAYIAAGDPGSAAASLGADRVDDDEELGDLFDLHQGPEIDGRDTIADPPFAAEGELRSSTS